MNGGLSSKRLALRLRRQNRWGTAEATPGHAGHHHTHDGRDWAMGEGAKQVTQLKDHLMRTQAEFENFRKRSRRDAQQQAEQANKNLVGALLPVMDNFDRALANPGQSIDGLLSGLQMVQKQLHDLLGQEGVEKIDALDQPFDPNFHEAVATGENGELPDNHVMEVLQPGYLLKGKLIRPAMVRVTRG
jgi:molecular chaperone GrpE